MTQATSKDRIYLMGHSGGSFLGIHAVAGAPELYHAYIGVAQMANQLKSEERAYDYMLERCRAVRRRALARKLEAVPVHFLHGVHAYTCTYAEAATCFDSLTAPLKGFHTFSRSAHSPMFEEPDKVMAMLRGDTAQLVGRSPHRADRHVSAAGKQAHHIAAPCLFAASR